MKIIKISVAFLYVFIVVLCVSSQSKQYINASKSQQQRVFNINGEPRDIGDYSSVENFVTDELRKKGFSNFKIYDASELNAEILENRNGIAVVERCIGLVTCAVPGEEAGIILNTQKKNNHIGYGACFKTTDISEGTVVASYMVYSPYNNHVDDIISRYDFVVCREYED